MSAKPKPFTDCEFVSVQQIADRLNVNRATVWRWNKHDETFPRPYRLSTRFTRWKRSEIDAWLEAQVAA